MAEARKSSLFIIDDDLEIQVIYSELFKQEEIQVNTFTSARTAFEYLRQNGAPPSSVVLCDLKLPDMSGLEFIDEVSAQKWNIPVILVTAHASVETAVEALKKGAFDYVIKTVQLDNLCQIVQRARQFQKDHSDLRSPSDDQISTPQQRQSMIGKSNPIKQVFELVDRVARSNANVLITGESGTGKEMVARSIHQRSTRKDFPFVAINCSAIPDYLLGIRALWTQKRGIHRSK